MISGRRVASVLSLAVAFVACSSSDSPGPPGATTGTSGGSTTGTGGGSGNACKTTMCRNEFPYTDDICDQILASSCATMGRTAFACSLANDACKADGTQDFTKEQAACRDDDAKFLACLEAVFYRDAGTD
jgi:hypothetical protein